MSIQFRILGPLEVSTPVGPARLGGTKQREVLADLLIHANHPVSMDRLIEDLWGEEPPKSAANAIQVHVSALRRALGKEADRVLLTRAPGYVLRAGPGEVDALAFEAMAVEGRELVRSDPRRAAEILGRTLALWRGSPLPEFAYESFAQTEIARLEELQLTVVEDRMEARLALGRHAEIVGELKSMIAAQPLRERLRAHLMLALYRSGRQAEALEVYRATRQALAEELGIDPSPALQRLEAAILAQDPNLDWDDPGVPSPLVRSTKDREQTHAVGPARRKVVTVVYVDIAAISNHGTIDPEVRRAVMSQAAQAVMDAVTNHGGTPRIQAGGAIVGVFGAPDSHEDDPVRAIRAVVDAREALSRVTRDLDDERSNRVTARFGVMTGDAVIGAGAADDQLSSTDALALATRLSLLGEPGECLLGEPTHRLIRTYVDDEALPIVGDAGAHLIGAYRLVALREGASARTLRLDAKMVGREQELRLLDSALDRVAQGHRCSVVLVVGAPGIGKSRLTHEFVNRASGSARILHGRCLSYGEGITYWPLGEIVREAAGIADTDPPETVLGKIQALMGGTVQGKGAATIVAGLIGVTSSAFSAEETPWAVRYLLESIARDGPAVVVVDDVQWAESAFLRLLDEAAGQTSAPVLLLCLARPELLEDHPQWPAAIADVATVTLAPLETEASSALVQGLLGGVPPPEAISRRVLAVAEGNPLFLQELLSMLIDDGLLWMGEDGVWVAGDQSDRVPMPPSLSQLLASRLERLGPEERAVVERASVEGQAFHAGAVAYLTPEGERLDVPAHLFSLVRKGLLVPGESDFAGEVAFRFRHILIREAAYERVLKGERAELHERFADWLTEGAGDRLAEYEEIVGYHFEQAHRYRMELGAHGVREGELGRRAARALTAAGRRALDRDDHEAAHRLFERSLALLASDDPGRLELRYLRAYALREGETASIHDLIASLDEIVQEAQGVGDRRIEALAVAFRTDQGWHQGTSSNDQSLRIWQACLEALLELGDAAGGVRIRALMGRSEMGRGRADTAFAIGRENVEAARRLSPAALHQALWGIVASAFYGSTSVSELFVLIEELRPLAQTPLAVAHMERSIPSLLAMSGRSDEVGPAIDRLIGALREIGPATAWASTVLYTGPAARLAGDLEGSEGQLRAAIRVLWDEWHNASLGCSLMTELGRTLCEVGRYDEAGDWVRQAREIAGADDIYAQSDWRGVAASVAAHGGRFDEALDLAHHAVAISDVSDYLDFRAVWRRDLAGVLRMAGLANEARTALTQAISMFERKGNIVMARRARDEAGGLDEASHERRPRFGPQAISSPGGAST